MMAAVGDSFVSGKLPYRDSWDLKGPFAYVPFALAELLFGKVMWGIRVVDLAILVPALYCVFRVIQAYTTAFLAACTSLFLYLWLVSAGWFFTAQPDTWVAAASAVAICPLLLPGVPHSAQRYALAGLIIGCAGLIKPFYLGLGLVPLTIIGTLPALSISQRARLVLPLACGAAVPILLVAAYFAAGGGLSKLVEVHLVFTTHAYGPATRTHLGTALLNFMTQGPALLMVPLAILGLFSARREARLFAPMAVWLILALLFVIIQKKYFIYHWYPLYPVLCILAALKMHDLLESSSHSFTARTILYGIAFVLCVQTVWVPAKEIARFALYKGDVYYRKFYHYTYVAADQMKAAEHIRAHSRQDELVFVYSIDATARFLSQRSDPTRFTFDMPLIMESPLRTEYRAEAMTALRRTPPTYVIYGSPWTLDKPGTLRAFPELAAFVAEGYAIEKSFGAVDLYRRNDHGK